MCLNVTFSCMHMMSSDHLNFAQLGVLYFCSRLTLIPPGLHPGVVQLDQIVVLFSFTLHKVSKICGVFLNLPVTVCNVCILFSSLDPVVLQHDTRVTLSVCVACPGILFITLFLHLEATIK